MKGSSQVRSEGDRLLVKTGLLAQVIAVTPRQIQKLVKAGTLPAPGPQAWHDLAAAVRAYVLYVDAGRMDSATLAAQRERLTRAQAVKVEMDNAQRRGQLVLAGQVAEVMNGMAADLAARLEGLPGRIAQQLAVMTSAAEIRMLLQREHRSIRQGVADHFAKLAAGQPPKVAA